MERTNHLLYLDITNLCYVGCDFCMYATQRDEPDAHMSLDATAQKNIRGFFRDPHLGSVMISGEGEPFENKQGLIDILRLSPGDRHFQIITSGVIGKKEETFNQLVHLAEERGDDYSIRLSIDQGHLDVLGYDHYRTFVRAIRPFLGERLTLSFRGVIEQKDALRAVVAAAFAGEDVECESQTSLDDDFYVGACRFPATYKNLVSPNGFSSPSLEIYLGLLEKKYARPFTLGNLRSSSEGTGLDVTIKMNGDVMFYGAEIATFGNIHVDDVSFGSLSQSMEGTPVLRRLYEVPFLNILGALRKDPVASALIDKVNNPYWIVKTLHDEMPGKIEEAIADASEAH